MNLRKLASLTVVGVGLLMPVACAEVEDSESDDQDTQASGDPSEKTSGGGNESRGEADELDDVRLDDCSKDRSLGWSTATLEITNDSSEPSDYSIEVTFESRDGSKNFGTGIAFVTNIAAGQSKTEEVSSLEEATGKFKCKITSVDRTASS